MNPHDAQLDAGGSPRLGRRRANEEAFAPVLFLTLSQIVGYLISVIIVLVIVQFVLSLLISFNVVSMHNRWVAAIW